jgi:Kef-type K+ transport system membrane component KefB
METKKRFRLGKYSLVIGIAAGFVALGMIISLWEGTPDATEIFFTVGIVASSMAVFLQSMEEQKKKSCRTSTPKI